MEHYLAREVVAYFSGPCETVGRWSCREPAATTSKILTRSDFSFPWPVKSLPREMDRTISLGLPLLHWAAFDLLISALI